MENLNQNAFATAILRITASLAVATKKQAGSLCYDILLHTKRGHVFYIPIAALADQTRLDDNRIGKRDLKLV